MRRSSGRVAKTETLKPGGALSAAMRSGVASTLAGLKTLVGTPTSVPSPCWADTDIATTTNRAPASPDRDDRLEVTFMSDSLRGSIPFGKRHASSNGLRRDAQSLHHG